MSNIIGYLRPSINEMDLQGQLDQLKASGVSKVYQDKPLSKKVVTPHLDTLLKELQRGDTLVTTSLSRIACNTKHLLEIMQSLKASGVALKVIDSGVDTSTSHGDVIDLLLSAIVDFERDIVRERQSTGIARAKKEGLYKGRKPTARAKADEVMALAEQGLTRQKIADELGIGVASVYRILKTSSEGKKPRKQNVKSAKKIVKTTDVAIEKQQKQEQKKPREESSEQLSFF